MKLDNQTHWRTDQIRTLALRVAQEELDAEKRKRYTIRVRYGQRGSRTSGRAHIGGWSCQINLGSDAVDPINLAHTLAHEMAHSRGMGHPAMRGSARYRYVPGWREFYAWAASYPIERKPVQPKPTIEAKREIRLERARTNLAAWLRREKLARTKVRRWRGRVRDLERYIALAASAAPRQAP